MWLEADRMRSLDVSAENLKNQQNVVSEEVRVNVLNQPHAAFEWLDIWENANSNWHNAHNFYGDLSRARGGDARRRAGVLQDLLRAEQRRARRRRRHHAGRGAGARREAFRGDSLEARCRRRPTSPSRRRTTRSGPRARTKLARTPALAIAWHLPPRMTKDFFALSVLDPLLVSDESARLYQKLVRDDRLATSVIGAFNFLGSNWDMKGPMLYTVRVDYLNDKTAAQVLGAVEEVLAEIRTKGITEAELARPRRRCARRSSRTSRAA